MVQSTQILLHARPEGAPKQSDFETRTVDLPELEDGQILVRSEFVSVDPYMRGRMTGRKTYIDPIAVGAVVEGGAVGHVVASKFPGLEPGDAVLGMWGWQTAAITGGRQVQKLDTTLGPLAAFLGVLGMPGMTAYFGLLDIGQPKPGETVFVSGAAGAVGALVGQIAKLKGCRAVGSAGSPEKVDYLLNECGFDAAFDYHTPNLNAALKEACPNGIDVYFDNVGGALSDAATMQMNERGRISVCGQIEHYNATEVPMGPRLMFQFIVKRLRAEGFIVSDFYKRHAEARTEIAAWIREGKVSYRETITDGIANTPAAFMGLFTGENTGKQLVRVLETD
jgi:NADPH-dependent curcumin reductase CurA